MRCAPGSGRAPCSPAPTCPSATPTTTAASPPAPAGGGPAPVDTAGVAAAMRLCHEHGQAVVPQGGLTGLCGGARASRRRGRAVARAPGRASRKSTRRRRRSPCAPARRCEVVQQAADDAGFFFPLDLGARGSCAIGGNLVDQRRRQPRDPLRHGARIGARARGRAARRHDRRLHEQDAEEQRRLRPEAPVHRQRRHARHHHQGRAADVPASRHARWPRCARCSDFDACDRAACARRGASVGPLLSAFEVMWPDYWAGRHRPRQGRAQSVRRRATTAPTCWSRRWAPIRTAIRSASKRWLEGLLEAGTLPRRRGRAVDGRRAGVLGRARRLRRVLPGQVLGPHLAFDIGLPVDAMDRYRDECKAALAARIPGCRERVLRPHRRRQHAPARLGARRGASSPRRRSTKSSTAWCASITAPSPPSTASAR